MFLRIVILKMFAIFKVKHPCWSLFLTKLQAGLQLYWKQTPWQVFSCKIAKFLITVFSLEHLRWLFLEIAQFFSNMTKIQVSVKNCEILSALWISRDIVTDISFLNPVKIVGRSMKFVLKFLLSTFYSSQVAMVTRVCLQIAMFCKYIKIETY